MQRDAVRPLENIGRRTLRQNARLQLGHGQRHVGHAGDGERLAVVDGFQLGELLQLPLDEVGELPQQAAPLRPGHPRPRAAVEGPARGRDGTVHVLLVGFRHLGQHRSRGRIVDRERLARCRRHPLAVDEQLAVVRQELDRGLAEAAVERNRIHGFLLLGWLPRGPI